MDVHQFQAMCRETSLPAMACPPLVVMRGVVHGIQERHGEFNYAAGYQNARNLRKDSLGFTDVLQYLVADRGVNALHRKWQETGIGENVRLDLIQRHCGGWIIQPDISGFRR